MSSPFAGYLSKGREVGRRSWGKCGDGKVVPSSSDAVLPAGASEGALVDGDGDNHRTACFLADSFASLN